MSAEYRDGGGLVVHAVQWHYLEREISDLVAAELEGLDPAVIIICGEIGSCRRGQDLPSLRSCSQEDIPSHATYA
ncbi:hypothetical protein N7508_005708 [Penicillium antarcticum]|uniref:uncharacterized protein n=1 Tax=Penicillium antarcticum TaxID=416450 RepID=UPI00238CD58A|nr:uncharacterized protein N7508_005708 [Penicillium antarcticum]KAJ5306693.1 hypothetical protein N7508_005708 [Penicillium antarcticum]